MIERAKGPKPVTSNDQLKPRIKDISLIGSFKVEHPVYTVNSAPNQSFTTYTVVSIPKHGTKSTTTTDCALKREGAGNLQRRSF